MSKSTLNVLANSSASPSQSRLVVDMRSSPNMNQISQASFRQVALVFIDLDQDTLRSFWQQTHCVLRK
jgi:hypothetical protein